MNSERIGRGGRAPSRFVRGRARGGGAYRPYFYFRRNGRVIPAGRNGQTANEDSEAPGTSASTRPRGWNSSRGVGGSRRKTASNAALDCSYLRPEYYAAPADALRVNSLLVDNPKAYPGWRLYLMRDEYIPDSELAKRIIAVEAYFQRNPDEYHIATIREERSFRLPANGIANDEHLKVLWPTLAEDVRSRPQRALSIIGLAMYTVVHNDSLDSAEDAATAGVLKLCTKDMYVPLDDPPAKIYVRPEQFTPVELINSITHDRVDSLFAMRGIVRTVGEPTYTLAWHTFRCTRCQAEQTMRQRGNYEPRPFHCLRPQCAGKEFLTVRTSPYTRLLVRQIIRLEESSISLLTDYDSTRPSELDIELRHELVDSVCIGQEIVVTGVLKLRELCDSNEAAGTATATAAGLEAYLRACSVQDARHVNREFNKFDIEAISMINSEPNSFQLLVHSLAPEVHGHELPKAACLLSLLGGSVDDDAINVLLVGDPGMGKSVILQHCAQATERGAHISGKRAPQASNQLGITFTGRNKRAIDAGALLLANSSGHCLIDGVDKLASKQALLMQTMQAGQLNVLLPGVCGSFEGKPSIIACANPQRGQYDQTRYLLQNIRITASLLKEFHLVFVLLDKPSATRDISLTEHVRALHAGAKKRAKIAANYAMKTKKNDSIYEDRDSYASAENTTTDETKDSFVEHDYDLDKRLMLDPKTEPELDLLPPILMKKFIAYARQNVKPVLNDDAANAIKWYFQDLCRRSEAKHEHSQIGMSQLLGLISLSEARARLDLSSIVTPAHVRDVIAVITESMAQTRVCDGQAGAAGSFSSRNGQLQSFVQMMQLRSAALGRRILEYEELKEIGRRAGILTGIAKLVDQANLAGYLLKKGVDMYEVVRD
ncbi:hypothetical protein KR222_007880 [Zaprionus bogoriensis]|nr:hypothetical protein KR222_007880 [Zaprionus bogoriensis]